MRSGDRVLVLGAAGGVGAFAVQLALQFGGRVTGTAMEGDREFVAALGPVEVVVPAGRESHSDALEPGSFDLVLDTVGRASHGAVAAADPPGRELHHPAATAAQPLADALGVEGIFFVVRPTRSALDRLRESVDAGRLGVTIAATYPLTQGRIAYESGALPGRSPGKTVLVVRTDDETTT